MAALLRSCARVPLLELGAQGVRLGLGTHAPGVTRGFLFATASAYSYHPLLVRLGLGVCACLGGSQPCLGTAPGKSILGGIQS